VFNAYDVLTTTTLKAKTRANIAYKNYYYSTDKYKYNNSDC